MTTTTTRTTTEGPITIADPPAPPLPVTLGETSLLRLLQLCSPALPIGAFAYSQGLEPAVVAGWVHDEASAAAWIGGLLQGSLATLDLPALTRLYEAWENNVAAVDAWTALLSASRTAAELQAEDRHLGGALARVLSGLDLVEASPWIARDDVTYAAMFALAACRWGVPLQAALSAYAFVWCETQVSAAVRLIPLGQSAGQRVLSTLGAAVPAAVARAVTVTDDQIGASAPAHGLASALHETQYSRLFRS